MSSATPRAASRAVPRPPIAAMRTAPTHPGTMLREEFLVPLGIPQTAFAERLRVPLQRLNELVLGKRGVTPDTALRLARALGTSAELWLRLQENWDLWHAARGKTADEIAAIEPLPHDDDGRLVA